MEGCRYSGSRPVVRARICSQLSRSFQALIDQQLHEHTEKNKNAFLRTRVPQPSLLSSRCARECVVGG